jgi:hypothetical protein
MKIDKSRFDVGIAGTGLLDKNEQAVGLSVAVISIDAIGKQSRADLDKRIVAKSPAFDPEVSALFAFVGGSLEEPNKVLYWPVGHSIAQSLSVAEAEDWLKTSLLAERPILAAHSRFMVPLQFGKWPVETLTSLTMLMPTIGNGSCNWLMSQMMQAT